MVWFLNTGGKKVPTYLKLLQRLTALVCLPEEYLFSQNIGFVSGRRAGWISSGEKKKKTHNFKNMSSSNKWSSCQECDYSEKKFLLKE